MVPRVSALADHLAHGPAWMYDWDFGELGSPPLADPGLPSLQRTRLELIEPPVRAALADAGPGAVALDLGCSEGWFSHRLLEWGAARVVGVDLRPENIERAIAVRDHLGVPAERLELVAADVFELDPDALGSFDVVLAIGLVYHLENPVGALRRARRLTRRVCIVETELTRRDEPAAAFAARVEHSASVSPLGAAQGLVSLIPNRAAIELAVHMAGFGRSQWQPPAEHHFESYRRGARGVLAAFPTPSSGRASWLDFPTVEGRIHPNDDILYPQDPYAEHYARTGRSAIANIEAALALAGRELGDVESCLDLACGYGRVLRLLRERIAPERITACDVMPEAVAFCAYEFGARPLLSDPEFDGVPFATYDLIWVGSLVTHLDERLLGRFTALLARLLAPGGVALVTTLGDYGIEDVSRYEARLAPLQDALEGEYRRRGFAFVPYEGRSDGLGYAWHAPEMLCDAIESASRGTLRRLAQWPRGWDHHQDILVFGRD